jgi:hypothetical protein
MADPLATRVVVPVNLDGIGYLGSIGFSKKGRLKFFISSSTSRRAARSAGFFIAPKYAMLWQ